MKLNLSRLKIEGTDLVLENGLTLDRVEVYGEGVSYDTSAQRLRIPRTARLEAFLSRERAAEMVAANPPEAVKDLAVELLEGRVRVTAKVQAIVTIGVTATGTLEPVGGARIHFNAEEVRVGGVGAPGGIVDTVLSRINPVVDLSELPFPMSITRIEVRPDGIRLYADVGPL